MSDVIANDFSFTCQEIRDRYPKWIVAIDGDPGVRVRRVSSPSAAQEGSLVFCSNVRSLAAGVESKASALVASSQGRDSASEFSGPVLYSDKPELFMATFLNDVVLRTPYRDAGLAPGIHVSATVHPQAQIDHSATIGPGARVGAHASVGPRAYVGANSVIEAGVKIGADTTLHPMVFVGHSTSIGARCEIHPNTTIGKEGFGYAPDEQGILRKIPHIGRVIIEDDVHIGANCSIDRATLDETRISSGARLDNQIHIAHNCSVGFASVLTACFAMAGSSHIGKYFLAGGRANVTGHVKVGDGVRIAALSAISKDLFEPGEYGGVPLVPIQTHVKIKAALVHLPEMRKQLARLSKFAFGESGD